MYKRFFTKAVALLLMGITATMMVACLGSDDDGDNVDCLIAPQEYGPLLNMMAGSYQGKLYYTDLGSVESKLDSAIVSATFAGVGDSTITVSGVPAKCLARLMKNEAAKAAVEQEGLQTIDAKFYLYQNYSEHIYYAVIPQPLRINVNYDGADHQIEFILAQTNTNFGVFFRNETIFEFNVYRILIDGDTDVSLYYPTDINSRLGVHVWK